MSVQDPALAARLSESLGPRRLVEHLLGDSESVAEPGNHDLFGNGLDPIVVSHRFGIGTTPGQSRLDNRFP